MNISVITPTTRPEGLELVQKALLRQTMTDFEWVVSAPRNVTVKGFKRIDTLLSDPPKRKQDYWSIYKSYNKMIRHSLGELIVSWQDYTFTNPDTLERFLTHFELEPTTLVGAVGNKYADESFTAMTWRDPRETNKNGSFYPCYFNDIEWNLCAVPKKAIYAVGGFDEELDKYSSLCGLDVLERLAVLGGYDFKLDQGIKSFSTEHTRLPYWEENSPFTGGYEERKQELKSKGLFPVLTYLENPPEESVGYQNE